MTGLLEFLGWLGQLLRNQDQGFFPIHFHRSHQWTATPGTFIFRETR